MIKRIFVGISATPARPAKIRYSSEIATRFDASRSLMSVIDTDRPAPVGPIPVGPFPVGPFPVGLARVAHKMRVDRIQRSHQNADPALRRLKAAAETGCELGSGLNTSLMERTFGATAITMARQADRPLVMTH
jgi:hypothetical protein